MGKDHLFALKYQDLLRCIVNETRNKARGIPAFRDSGNGCIRITLEPLSELAEAWLGGGLSGFVGCPEADVCEREFVFPIRPGGSYTIWWADPDDGHKEPVNCYAYSAMKVAFAKVKKFMGDFLKFLTEDNGWAQHAGAVCELVTLDGEDFLNLCVCVSGAESKQDEQCALCGAHAAYDFFMDATEIAARGYADGIPNFRLDFKMTPDFIDMQDT